MRLFSTSHLFFGPSRNLLMEKMSCYNGNLHRSGAYVSSFNLTFGIFQDIERHPYALSLLRWLFNREHIVTKLTSRERTM